MQINQQVVRLNWVLTKKINKTPNVHKPLFREWLPLFSECKLSIN